jgi:hypothetical protein
MKHNSLKTLSLFGNQILLEKDLRGILARNPQIRTLHLLNTPQIPLDRKIEVAKDAKISELLDSTMLAFPLVFSPLQNIPPSLRFSSSYLTPPVKQTLIVEKVEGTKTTTTTT